MRDIEQNPGMQDELLKLVKETNERCIRIEANQSSMAKAIDEIKGGHESIVSTVSNISTRLEAVEKQAASLERCQQDQAGADVPTGRLREEITTLRARLDDAEDRSRRDNLLFFGIKDSPKESWQESEGKVISFASEILQLQIPATDIARAHRIGQYSADKNRPIVVKFSAFKTKELIQAKRSLLTDTNFNIREDFSLSTRIARKKLLDFGKGLTTSYKLRHNKLIADGKHYMYCANADSVLEVSTVGSSLPAVVSPVVASTSPRSTRSGRVYGQPKGS